MNEQKGRCHYHVSSSSGHSYLCLGLNSSSLSARARLRFVGFPFRQTEVVIQNPAAWVQPCCQGPPFLIPSKPWGNPSITCWFFGSQQFWVVLNWGASSKANTDQHICIHPPAHTNSVHHFNKTYQNRESNALREFTSIRWREQTVSETQLTSTTRSLKFCGS